MLDHVSQFIFHAEEDPVHIHRHNLPPVVGSGLVESHPLSFDPSVVVRHVQSAEVADHLVDHRPHLYLVGDVHCEEPGFATKGFDLFHRGPTTRLIDVGDRHSGPPLRESQASGPADARRSTGYESYSIVEFAHHPSLGQPGRYRIE